eukprot:jgi/Phyca11/506633/fgenesh2_kg.PHYCAscaffold_21_\
MTRTLIAPPVPGFSVADIAAAAALALTGLQLTVSCEPKLKRLSDARACDSRSSSTERVKAALVSGAGCSDSALDMLCVLLVGLRSRVVLLLAMLQLPTQRERGSEQACAVVGLLDPLVLVL